jgi:hypothetical protein
MKKHRIFTAFVRQRISTLSARIEDTTAEERTQRWNQTLAEHPDP